MIKQKINLVADWLLGMRKRLSETFKVWKKWCSQKVQHFHKLMKSSRIPKVTNKVIPNEPKTKAQKKTSTKTKTAKKTTTKKK